MQSLTPTQMELLSKAIGDRFDFDALGYLLFKCVGDNKIAEIAARANPSRQVALACLRQTESDGVTVSFLAFATEMRRSDQLFIDLVHETVPAVAEARPTAKEAVSAVVKALFEAHALLGQPEILAAVRQSRDTFSQIDSAIIALDVHKGLHDNLHQLQLRRYESLQEAADFVGQGDGSKTELLRNFQDKLLFIQPGMAGAAGQLPLGDIGRRVLEQWIAKLATAAEMLQTALDERDGPRAKMSLGIVQRILENEPTQINRVIFATARALPLPLLVDTLSGVAAAAGAAAREIATGAVQVRVIHGMLTARVAEHQLWQEADDNLWTIGRVFRLPPVDVLKDFATLWPLVRSQYEVLYGAEIDQGWAQKVHSYATSIEHHLTALDGRLSEAGTLTGDDIAPLQEVFDNFRAQVRLQFFHADKALRAECAALLEIGTPIKHILASLVEP